MAHRLIRADRMIKIFQLDFERAVPLRAGNFAAALLVIYIDAVG
jgi:hypothetical protein